jgi:hypothetical protein
MLDAGCWMLEDDCCGWACEWSPAVKYNFQDQDMNRFGLTVLRKQKDG